MRAKQEETPAGIFSYSTVGPRPAFLFFQKTHDAASHQVSASGARVRYHRPCSRDAPRRIHHSNGNRRQLGLRVRMVGREVGRLQRGRQEQLQRDQRRKPTILGRSQCGTSQRPSLRMGVVAGKV